MSGWRLSYNNEKMKCDSIQTAVRKEEEVNAKCWLTFLCHQIRNQFKLIVRLRSQMQAVFMAIVSLPLRWPLKPSLRFWFRIKHVGIAQLSVRILYISENKTYNWAEGKRHCFFALFNSLDVCDRSATAALYDVNYISVSIYSWLSNKLETK